MGRFSNIMRSNYSSPSPTAGASFLKALVVGEIAVGRTGGLWELGWFLRFLGCGHPSKPDGSFQQSKGLHVQLSSCLFLEHKAFGGVSEKETLTGKASEGAPRTDGLKTAATVQHLGIDSSADDCG
ncbi:hypothetical protein GJAV_G00047990 [Gymnothorax javanicus]|nr:hypothetical protein GJAV_G00047990 [Gymnothorax javanicus]